MLIFSEAREGEGMQKSLSYFWLAGLEPKALLNSLFRLHLIITNSYMGKKMFPVNITMTARNCCVRHVHSVIEYCRTKIATRPKSVSLAQPAYTAYEVEKCPLHATNM